MSAAPVFDRPGKLERPASDWTRDDTGRPRVLPDPEWTPATAPRGWLDPDGRLLPERYYTRVTTFGEALLDGTMLARWKMRRVALGMGRRPDYVVAAAGLTAEDRDKKALNDLAEKALEAAGPNAADIGTALHSFTERIDRGEPVGEIPPGYAADLDAYREQVGRLHWFHREERMVCDRLETAGTPDGIALVDEPDPDGVVDLLRIVDLKTGNIETTAGKYSCQLGVYANSALYDAASGKRTRPGNLDRRWGIVLHMPAGVGTAELRWLNLEHGWLGAQLAGPVRRWRTVNYADLYRPLVKPEPRTVEPGRCGGVKRDGTPCTYRDTGNGYCGRHQDQVGTDPDAAVPARTQRVAAELAEALEQVPEPLRGDEQPAEPSTAVDEPVDGQPATALEDPDGELKPSSGVAEAVQPEPRDRGRLERPEQQGNPTPRSGLATPDDAKDAAQKAELGLMDQVRACRTRGELDLLYQRTGFAWSDSVKRYASRHLQLLPELGARERVDAALLAAIAGCQTLPELQALGRSYPVEQWTDEAKAAARAAAAELPPF